MKAAVIDQHGDVDCIRVEEVPEPVLGPAKRWWRCGRPP